MSLLPLHLESVQQPSIIGNIEVLKNYESLVHHPMKKEDQNVIHQEYPYPTPASILLDAVRSKERVRAKLEFKMRSMREDHIPLEELAEAMVHTPSTPKSASCA